MNIADSGLYLFNMQVEKQRNQDKEQEKVDERKQEKQIYICIYLSISVYSTPGFRNK